MRPESGGMSPRASLRIRLLPEPATPNSALVSPRARRKEIPRSTSLPPKESFTSSNTMANAEFSPVAGAAESSGKVGANIYLCLVISEHGHQEPSEEQIPCQDQDRSR